MNKAYEPRPTKTTLYLIACSASKRAGENMYLAKDLYTGDLFAKSRAYVESQLRRREPETTKTWAIISAKYGILSPWHTVKTYEQRLDVERAKDPEYAAALLGSWEILASPCARDGAPISKIVMLCGQAYRDAMSRYVLALYPSITTEAPLAGLGIGQQKARLLQMAREVRP